MNDCAHTSDAIMEKTDHSKHIPKACWSTTYSMIHMLQNTPVLPQTPWVGKHLVVCLRMRFVQDK
jgi:hypothetical protein